MQVREKRGRVSPVAGGKRRTLREREDVREDDEKRGKLLPSQGDREDDEATCHLSFPVQRPEGSVASPPPPPPP